MKSFWWFSDLLIIRLENKTLFRFGETQRKKLVKTSCLFFWIGWLANSDWRWCVERWRSNAQLIVPVQTVQRRARRARMVCSSAASALCTDMCSKNCIYVCGSDFIVSWKHKTMKYFESSAYCGRICSLLVSATMH